MLSKPSNVRYIHNLLILEFNTGQAIAQLINSLIISRKFIVDQIFDWTSRHSLICKKDTERLVITKPNEENLVIRDPILLLVYFPERINNFLGIDLNIDDTSFSVVWDYAYSAPSPFMSITWKSRHDTGEPKAFSAISDEKFLETVNMFLSLFLQ